jgi:F-type H+-transporting ATPase subunit delta
VSELAEKSHKIAKRYGGVLFELAQKNKVVDDVLQDINRLRLCVESESQDWLRVASPALPVYTQRKVVERLSEVLRLGTLMTHFLMVLCQNRRLPDLNFILNAFFDRVKQAEGIIDGILETPLTLTDKEIKDLQKSLSAKLGDTVHLNQKINEKLLGGVVLRIGSLMIDGSVRTNLNKLKMIMKG